MRKYNSARIPKNKKAMPYEELLDKKRNFEYTETVSEYLARGGTITRIPSFKSTGLINDLETLEKLLEAQDGSKVV